VNHLKTRESFKVLPNPLGVSSEKEVDSYIIKCDNILLKIYKLGISKNTSTCFLLYICLIVGRYLMFSIVGRYLKY
jgi:hypothetical protein